MTRKARLSKRSVDAALPEAKQYTLWDTDLKGFGLRVMPSGVKSYYVQYRPKDSSSKALAKRYNIGKHGPITPDEARKRADEALRTVREGGDPQEQRQINRVEPTIAELWDLYRSEGCDLKSPATLSTDKSRYNSHILPLLGKKRLSEITQTDVETFQRDIAKGKTAVTKQRGGKGLERSAARATGGKGTASRTVGLLGGMFTFAMNHKSTKTYVKVNPVGGVKKFKDNKWERHLSAEELGRLGSVITESSENEKATRIILLLALTGARKSEIESLKREAFTSHLSSLQLRTSKTDYKVIAIGSAASAVLNEVADEGSEYFFPATGIPEKHFVGTYGVWRRIREKAGLSEVRLHDLRHTFASLGVTSTGNLALIGKLLGHRDVKTTSRYAHLADDPVRQAAETASGAAADALTGKPSTLTADQVDKARRMASIDLDYETISKALGVTVLQVQMALRETGQP